MAKAGEDPLSAILGKAYRRIALQGSRCKDSGAVPTLVRWIRSSAQTMRLLQDERAIYCTDSARTLDVVASRPDMGYNSNVQMFHGRK